MSLESHIIKNFGECTKLDSFNGLSATGNTHRNYKRAVKRAKADAFSSARVAAVTAQVGTDSITYVMLYPQYHTRYIQLSCIPNGSASVRYAKAHTTSIVYVLMLVCTLEVPSSKSGKD